MRVLVAMFILAQLCVGCGEPEVVRGLCRTNADCPGGESVCLLPEGVCVVSEPSKCELQFDRMPLDRKDLKIKQLFKYAATPTFISKNCRPNIVWSWVGFTVSLLAGQYYPSEMGFNIEIAASGSTTKRRELTIVPSQQGAYTRMQTILIKEPMTIPSGGVLFQAWYILSPPPGEERVLAGIETTWEFSWEEFEGGPQHSLTLWQS